MTATVKTSVSTSLSAWMMPLLEQLVDGLDVVDQRARRRRRSGSLSK